MIVRPRIDVDSMYCICEGMERATHVVSWPRLKLTLCPACISLLVLELGQLPAAALVATP